MTTDPTAPTVDPRAVISFAFAGLYDPARAYPRPLPAELAPWHLRTVDGGHCLAVAVESILPVSGPAADWLAAVPVRTVLRVGYTIHPDGWVIAPVPYDPDLGVIAPEDETEY